MTLALSPAAAQIDGQGAQEAGSRFRVYVAKYIEDYFNNWKGAITGYYNTIEQIHMIESVVMHEVGYCSRESKIAVANVILNRLKDGRFGDSIYGVLHAKGQFGAIHNYYDKEIEPDKVCREAVTAALRGEDNSHGALYFCNMKYITNPGTKRWFSSLKQLFVLDGQMFFTDKEGLQ